MNNKYGGEAIRHMLSPTLMGPMERADGYSKYKGPCGDTMEFFLRVKDDVIEEVSFTTDGCVHSAACGNATAEEATGKTPSEAMGITQGLILRRLGGFPAEFEHCALLAVTTLRKAVVDYEKNKKEPWKKLYVTR